ncbi:unnamed protein product, partial [Prorocentrum cordatum]
MRRPRRAPPAAMLPAASAVESRAARPPPAARQATTSEAAADVGAAAWQGVGGLLLSARGRRGGPPAAAALPAVPMRAFRHSPAFGGHSVRAAGGVPPSSSLGLTAVRARGCSTSLLCPSATSAAPQEHEPAEREGRER